MRRVLVVIVLFLVFPWSLVQAEIAQVQLVVGKEEAFQGEGVPVQIRITGTDQVVEPDLTDILDFRVEKVGGGASNTSAVTILNGRMNRVERKGYTVTYKFYPLKKGILTIPKLSLKVDGRTRYTKPIEIKVKAPEENEDFILKLTGDLTNVYVGQPIDLTVTWFLTREAKDVQFDFPALDSDRFKVIFRKPSQGKRVKVNFSGQEVEGVLGRSTYQGKSGTTVTTYLTVVPKKSGAVEFSSATVAFEAVEGYSKRLGGFFSDDIFNDPFFGGRKSYYRKFVVPSNSLFFEVKELPTEGRPDDFSGLVGNFEISAEIGEREFSVGEPVPLVVSIKGDGIDSVIESFPIDRQSELLSSFKVPKESKKGTVLGETRSFSYTIRAKESNIDNVPSLRLSYFDPLSKAYKVAVTKPIPITVKSTKVITVNDGEASGGVVLQERPTIETVTEGVGANYVGKDVLVNQEFRLTSLFLLILVLPPSILIALILIPRFLSRQEGRRSIVMDFRRKVTEDDNFERVVSLYVKSCGELLGKDEDLTAQEILVILNDSKLDLGLRSQKEELVKELISIQYGGRELDIEKKESTKRRMVECLVQLERAL